MLPPAVEPAAALEPAAPVPELEVEVSAPGAGVGVGAVVVVVVLLDDVSALGAGAGAGVTTLSSFLLQAVRAIATRAATRSERFMVFPLGEHHILKPEKTNGRLMGQPMVVNHRSTKLPS